jgi:hypothetical protein
MSILDWLLEPEPQVCPAPVELPDWYRNLGRDTDILPPLPDPPPPLPPPPTREAGLAAAIAAALAVTTTMRDDDDCEDCEPCLAVLNGTGGIPPRMPYGDQRTNRVGYEYQHYVVNWFFHDPVGRFIMEWQFGGVWFDGLDHKQGTMLYGRGIARAEYDPGGVSQCYLIDTKYGYDSWVRYDAWNQEWVAFAPPFLIKGLTEEIDRQYNVVSHVYPNVALVWDLSGDKFKAFADRILVRPRSPVASSVYYTYLASEDR